MSTTQDELKTRLVEALRAVPGARQLVEFGSARHGQPDIFSDVDLQLLVDDCAAARPAFLTILGNVVSPEVEWTISDDPDHYWLMVIPDASQPWLKVDIGLDPYNAGHPEDLDWTGEIIWAQHAPTDPFTTVTTPAWPRPAPGSIANFVMWQLVDLGRLAKFTYRGESLNMLARIGQLANAVVTVEAMRQGQHDDFFDEPSTTTISELDQALFASIVDLQAPLVDVIANLANRLCDAVDDDEHLRYACDRMVSGSLTVLRTLLTVGEE